MDYYFDTSIWIDLLEDRKGFVGEPLGGYAMKLICSIRSDKSVLVISDLLIKELVKHYTVNEIKSMLKPFERFTRKIVTDKRQEIEARKLALQRNVPQGDALHAILARDNNLLLIARDNHFRRLEDISDHYRPEDLI